MRCPEDLSDEDAVMVEPAACAVQRGLRRRYSRRRAGHGLGAGTLGLCVDRGDEIAFACRALSLPLLSTLIQRGLARELGADQVVRPSEHKRAAGGSRDLWRSKQVTATSNDSQAESDLVVDCVGSAESLQQCLEVVRPGGRVLLVGMPGVVRVDLAPLWQREIELRGAYAYGTEERPEGPRSTFQLALELVREARLGRLVSARYPLESYEPPLLTPPPLGGAERKDRVRTCARGSLQGRTPRRRTAKAASGRTSKEAQ